MTSAHRISPRWILFVLFWAVGATLHAAPLLNYQGRIAADGTNFTGSGRFKFALVSPDGTQTYWSNDGSGAGGAAPGSYVTLPVDQGYYTVQLGDTTLANMAALPPAVLLNNEARLRVWFDDGVHGFELLSPDQKIAAAGYALVAESIRPEALTAAVQAGGTGVQPLAANLTALAGLSTPGLVRRTEGGAFVADDAFLERFAMYSTPLLGRWPSVSADQPVVTSSNASNIADSVEIPTSNRANPLVLDPRFRFLRGHIGRLDGPDAAFPFRSNVTSAFSSSEYAVEFCHEGAAFELITFNNSQKYRVLADGRLAGNVRSMTSDGAARWTRYVYPTRATRLIRVEGGSNFALAGVAIGPRDTLFYPPSQPDPRAIFIGDSFTEPTGASYDFTGWAQLASQLLRWEGWQSGSGGTGFLVGSAGRGGLITPTITGGVITELTIANGGSGYPANATLLVRFVGGGGSGATATALSDENGIVASVTLTAGGGGYTSSPAVLVFPDNGRFPVSVAERLADAINYTPRVLVVAAGLNDETDVAANGTANFTIAVNSTLAAYRAALPKLDRLIVVGPWWPKDSPYDVRDSVRDVLAAGAAAHGAIFIDPKGWITGTGRVGATTPTGNANWFTSADGTHPTPAGHEYLARRFVAAYLAAETGNSRPIDIAASPEPTPLIRYNGNPNGVIFGKIGDQVVRRDTGVVYRKTGADDTNTNWVTP